MTSTGLFKLTNPNSQEVKVKNTPILFNFIYCLFTYSQKENIMFAKDKVKTTIFALVLIVSLLLGGMTATQAQANGPEDLFGDAGDARPAADVPNPAYVERSRYVNVNVGMLFDAAGKPRTKQTMPEISLNLFPDVTYTGALANVKKDAMGVSWYGKLKGVQGYFYLVVTEGVFIAHVASPKGIYEVSWAGDNLYKAVKIDQSKFVDHDPAAVFAPPGDILNEGDLGQAADTGSTIDILVAYTDDARAAEGSTAAMKARIALAVTETNQSYANDGVTARLRLVHVEEYSYAETGNMGTDLSRLTNTTDTYFSTIHTLRNTYGADMVGLIVENGGSYCGLANAIMATATNAFQVTDRSCATGYYSFAHEFGHLQGARHDTRVDTSNTPYVYGHGYVHTSSNPDWRWRTIMAYNTKCEDLGYSCTRLQWWSNPLKTWGGAPMGVTNSSENYRVLNNTDTTVANFRQAVIGYDFTSTFTSSSSGWAAAYGSWSRLSTGYYYSAGVSGTFASAKYASKYGDLTYTARMKRNGSNTSEASYLIIRGNPASLSSSKHWQPSYIFGYTNSGLFSVWKISSTGVPTALKTWTTSSAILKGNYNTLKVVAVGSSLKFYINNALVYSGVDATYKTGQVGFNFYRSTTSTGNALYVDYASVYTTATADVRADEQVEQGVELKGGSVFRSPKP
jgi:hypothetical protein